jgi:hypothetical protein
VNDVIWETVERYVLQYVQTRKTVRISVETVSGWHLIDELPPEKAAFLSDMLRNEKPIYYAPENNSLKTNAEPIGE